MKKKKNTKIQLLLLLALSVSQYSNLNKINIIITCLIMLLFVASSIEECTVMIFELIPFFNLLNARIGETSFYYIIVIIYIGKYILYKKMRLSYKKIIILFIISILRLLDGNMEVFAKWFLLFTVVVITFKNELMIKNLNEIVEMITISTIISSIIGYIMLINGKSIYNKGYVYSRELGNVTRFAGLIGDSVFYSQFCAIIIAANLVVMYNNKIKLFEAISSMILFGFTLLSYSKTGLILCIISLFVFMIAEIIKNAQSKSKAIISVLMIILIAIGCIIGKKAIEKSDNPIISNYTTRFESKDLLTGRGEIYKYYINLLRNNPRSIWIGITDKEYTTPFYIATGVAFNRSHNIYIETIAIFGLLPTIGMMIFILYCMINFIKKNNKNLINLLPIIELLLSGVTLHGHYEFHYYTLVSICFAFLFYNIKGEKNERI